MRVYIGDIITFTDSSGNVLTGRISHFCVFGKYVPQRISNESIHGKTVCDSVDVWGGYNVRRQNIRTVNGKPYQYTPRDWYKWMLDKD